MLGGWFGGSGLSKLGKGDYEIGEEVESFHGSGSANALACESWRLFDARKRGEKNGMSILRLERVPKENTSSPKVVSAIRCWQSTKILRMPYILRFVDGLCDEAGEVALSTDRVSPLADWIETGPDERNLAWGAYCILQALAFLHGAEKCHGNVTPRSVLVTSAGDFKLWGLELCTHLVPKLDEKQDASLAFFRAHEHLVDDAYRSPERCARDWEAMSAAKVGASDMWALARVFEKAYSRREGGLPRELQVWTRRMTNEDPAKRPTALQVLRGCPLFRQAFLKELVSLQDLSATSMDDQVAFYERLHAQTRREVDGSEIAKGALGETLWKGACVHKLLPRLVASLQIALAPSSDNATRWKVVASALPLLVQIVDMEGDAIGDETMANAKSDVVGILESVLVLRDAKIRLEALKRIEALEPLLAPDFVNRKLFDSLLLGFSDEDDDHRLLTLMAMLTISPKLSDKNKSDRLLRVVKRLESDRSAKIRTNVIIFYGRLVKDLTEQLRVKVALPSFLKALDDKQSYVRLAAVRSLGACRLHFSPAVAARAVIPKLGPLLLDPSPQVRDAAFPCIEAYLSVARAEAEKLTKRDEEKREQLMQQKQQQAASASKNAAVSAAKPASTGPKKSAAPPAQKKTSAEVSVTKPGDAAPPAPSDSGASWTSWGLGAFNKVVSTAGGAMEAAMAVDEAPAPKGESQPPASPPPQPQKKAERPNKPAVAKKMEPKEEEGWGDGWGDDDNDNQEANTTSATDGWGDDGWGDDDDDPVPVVKKAPVAVAKATPTPVKKAEDPKAERERKLAARRAEAAAKRKERMSKKLQSADDDFFGEASAPGKKAPPPPAPAPAAPPKPPAKSPSPAPAPPVPKASASISLKSKSARASRPGGASRGAKKAVAQPVTKLDVADDDGWDDF